MSVKKFYNNNILLKILLQIAEIYNRINNIYIEMKK